MFLKSHNYIVVFFPFSYFHLAVHLADRNRKSNSGFKRWEWTSISSLGVGCSRLVWFFSDAIGHQVFPLVCFAIPPVYAFILLLVASWLQDGCCTSRPNVCIAVKKLRKGKEAKGHNSQMYHPNFFFFLNQEILKFSPKSHLIKPYIHWSEHDQ